MKKQGKTRKMSLHKETLRLLETDFTGMFVRGGVTEVRSECGSCPPSECHPTMCPAVGCSEEC
jgi:hypothetical protein